MLKSTNALDNEKSVRRFDSCLLPVGIIALVAVLMLLAFMIMQVYYQIENIREDTPVYLNAENRCDLTIQPDTIQSPSEAVAHQRAEEACTAAKQALNQADKTSDSLGLLLSLLQGGAILGGLGLGAAAYFGVYRQGQLTDRLELAEAKFRQLDNTLEEVRVAQKDLGEVRTLANSANNSAEVAEAYQEYSLKNYHQAYQILEPLIQTNASPRVFYLVGWLEIQHIEGKFEQGLEHLKRAVDLRPNWPAGRAAYGVALRRKARDLQDNLEHRYMLTQAVGELTTALSNNFYLVDPKRESFWTTVAGVQRELNHLDEAIEAFQNALKVTPNSSYPMGNLANLYLQKASIDSEQYEILLEQALAHFETTYTYAQQESVADPHEYFQIMDMAMSSLMLSQRDLANVTLEDRAFKTLRSALGMGEATVPMLKVSLKGWNDLLVYCPPQWSVLKRRIEKAIQCVEEVIDGKIVPADG